jgi:hypothetical protein
MTETVSGSRQSGSARRSHIRSIITSIGLAGLCVLVWGAYHAYLSHERDEDWKNQIEFCGAKVYRMGFSSSPMARVPILGQLFIRSSLAVFIPDSQAGRAVLHLLPQGPKLGRIWVHRDNVSKEVLEQIKAACPDVEITRYT